VLGAGFAQQVHVPAFRSDPHCEVRALAASTLAKAQVVAERLGIPRAYGGWRELLADAEIDAVAIALPAREQQQAVPIAARAGKHVFCEKPLAVDVSAAQAMLEAVEKAGVVHSIDFEFPEIDAWKQAHALLQQGAIGPLRHVALQWRVETTAYRSGGGGGWKVCAADGGGTLNSLVSHSFHYLEWLFGPIDRLHGRLRPETTAGEARTDLWLDFAAGFPGTVSVAADAFLGCGHVLEAYGEHGTLVLANRTRDYVNGFELWLGTRQKGALERVPTDDRVRDVDGRITAVRPIALRFLAAIREGTQVSPNLRHGLRVQQLIDATRRAAARELGVSGGERCVMNTKR